MKRKESFFQAPFHYHPEVELVYVTKSYGKRIIGNVLESFEAGDMVLLGSDLPHIWHNDEVFYKQNSGLKAEAIVLYFNKDIFSPLFYDLKESTKIKQLLEKAARGLQVTGKTQKSIGAKLELLARKKNFDTVIGLLKILNELSESNDLVLVNKEAYVSASTKPHIDRIVDVMNYVKQHFKEHISLSQISKLVNLTPQSFCRLFKLKTQKNFVEYFNEVRISNACKLLLSTDMTVSEIAYNCGFKTVSNFDKIFKKTASITPKMYRSNSQIHGQ